MKAAATKTDNTIQEKTEDITSYFCTQEEKMLSCRTNSQHVTVKGTKKYISTYYNISGEICQMLFLWF